MLDKRGNDPKSASPAQRGKLRKQPTKATKVAATTRVGAKSPRKRRNFLRKQVGHGSGRIDNAIAGEGDEEEARLDGVSRSGQSFVL